MKRVVASLLVALCASVSLTAYAYTDTGFFLIGRLEASSGTSGSYRVYPESGFTLPSVCEKSDFAVAQSTGVKSMERTLMDHLLLSAFLANRRVSLRLDGCHATDLRPLFRIVDVRIDR